MSFQIKMALNMKLQSLLDNKNYLDLWSNIYLRVYVYFLLKLFLQFHLTIFLNECSLYYILLNAIRIKRLFTLDILKNLGLSKYQTDFMVANGIQFCRTFQWFSAKKSEKLSKINTVVSLGMWHSLFQTTGSSNQPIRFCF